MPAYPFYDEVPLLNHRCCRISKKSETINGEITSFEDFCPFEESNMKYLDNFELKFDKIECGYFTKATYYEYSY